MFYGLFILIYYSNGGIFISLSEPLLEENLDIEGISLIYSSSDDSDLIGREELYFKLERELYL